MGSEGGMGGRCFECKCFAMDVDGEGSPLPPPPMASIDALTSLRSVHNYVPVEVGGMGGGHAHIHIFWYRVSDPLNSFRKHLDSTVSSTGRSKPSLS